MYGNIILLSNEKKMMSYENALNSATLVSTSWNTDYGGYYLLGTSVKLSPYVYYNFTHNGISCYSSKPVQIPMSSRNDYWYSVSVGNNISLGVNPLWPSPYGSVSIGVGTRGSYNGFNTTQSRSNGWFIWEGTDGKFYKIQLTLATSTGTTTSNPAVFSTNGTHSWRVPSGVTSVEVYDNSTTRISWGVSAGQTFSITITNGRYKVIFPGGGITLENAVPLYIKY